MLLWLNGAFGVGKSTTAQLIVKRDARWRIFDPEQVGYMLRANLSDQSFGDDFQHLPTWRRLVPVVAAAIRDQTGQDLVVVQTVLRSDYWTELEQGARSQDLKVFHVLLDADVTSLRQRIETSDDQTARLWRLDHLDRYASSRQWLVDMADVVVDTTDASPDHVAQQVLAAVGEPP